MRYFVKTIYLTLGTHHIDFSFHMSFQGGTTAIHGISKQTIEHF